MNDTPYKPHKCDRSDHPTGWVIDRPSGGIYGCWPKAEAQAIAEDFNEVFERGKTIGRNEILKTLNRI